MKKEITIRKEYFPNLSEDMIEKIKDGAEYITDMFHGDNDGQIKIVEIAPRMCDDEIVSFDIVK